MDDFKYGETKEEKKFSSFSSKEVTNKIKAFNAKLLDFLLTLFLIGNCLICEGK